MTDDKMDPVPVTVIGPDGEPDFVSCDDCGAALCEDDQPILCGSCGDDRSAQLIRDHAERGRLLGTIDATLAAELERIAEQPILCRSCGDDRSAQLIRDHAERGRLLGTIDATLAAELERIAEEIG